MTIEKLSPQDGQSLDVKAENIAKLKQLFPEILSEKGIDFSVLKQLLGEEIEESEERYSFNWNGKARARRLAQTPSTGTLRPCKEESKDWDTTQNLFIEGDNLEVLKLLQKSYHQKVRMIYIDPPYNTGNDLIYHDDFNDNVRNYLQLTGQIDASGNRLTVNVETSGRYHTNWLNMMYPRLKLARNLLRDDGVIFISIDDNEVGNLSKLCDEIFGEENFINQISVKAKPSSGASGGGEDIKLKKNVEYLLCYCKSKNAFGRFNDVFDERSLIGYIKEYKEEGKSWKYTRVLNSFGNRIFHTEIKDGSGEIIKIFKHENVEIITLADLAKRDNLSEEAAHIKYFDKIFRDTNAQSSIRQRVIEATDNLDTFYSIEYVPSSGRNKNKVTTLYYKGRNKDLIAWLSDVASLENGRLLKKDKVGTLWHGFNWNNVSKEGDIPYPNGKKPIAFIQRMLDLSSGLDADDLILDFFAGSGSVAHAVMSQNAKDGGRRKCISIQLDEKISDSDKKETYSAAEFASLQRISDITKFRLDRAGEKIREENAGLFENSNLDIGFRVFKLDSSNIKSWDVDGDRLSDDLLTVAEAVKPTRGVDDVLFEILLKYGLDLSLPISTHLLAGRTVFDVGGGALLVCLDKDITETVAEAIGELKATLAPAVCRVVFRDAGFADDAAKVNAVQVLKQFGIEDVKSL